MTPVEASLSHLTSLPVLLQLHDSRDDIFVVLLHVSFYDLSDVLLAPELGSELGPFGDQSCDLWVLHAGLPVERIHGCGSLKILVPGKVIVRVEGIDSGTQDFIFDPVSDHAIVDILGEVLFEHKVHAHALEIGDGLVLGFLVNLFRGMGREISFPFGLAEESPPESSEMLSGVPGVSMSPVEVSGADVEFVLERAFLEIL